MHWALFVPNIEQILCLEESPPPKENLKQNKTLGIVEKTLGEINFDRVYFGNEFCERAMPGQKEIEEALNCSDDKEFTLVTPYVTETGLNKIEDIFNHLVKIQPSCEIVVNDWGVLHLIKQKFPTFKPVLGRLLNKMLRDPKIGPQLVVKGSNKYQHFQTCSLAGSYMKRLLKEKYNVNLIEIDNLPQGIDRRLPEWGYEVAMYVPYGVVSTGRICFFQSWGSKKEEKFRTAKKSCRHLCRNQHTRVTDMISLIKQNQHWDLMQKGNTMFYIQSSPFLAESLKNAVDLGISRIIYQPEPF